MESNHRPPPYQGGALPTELREHELARTSLTDTTDRHPCRTLMRLLQRPTRGSVERETGIEPALVAWKATVLPLNYSRAGRTCLGTAIAPSARFVHAETGGGRWMTPGILPSAPPGPRLRRVPDRFRDPVEPFIVCFGGPNPPLQTSTHPETGGGRWIRTTEGVSQQIYSLPPLAAWVSLRVSLVPAAKACGSDSDPPRHGAAHCRVDRHASQGP